MEKRQKEDGDWPGDVFSEVLYKYLEWEGGLDESVSYLLICSRHYLMTI